MRSFLPQNSNNIGLEEAASFLILIRTYVYVSIKPDLQEVRNYTVPPISETSHIRRVITHYLRPFFFLLLPPKKQSRKKREKITLSVPLNHTNICGPESPQSLSKGHNLNSTKDFILLDFYSNVCFAVGFLNFTLKSDRKVVIFLKLKTTKNIDNDGGLKIH